MMSRQRTVDEIPAALRDGYEVHAAALARGLDVTLLPRQVMIVGDGGPAGQAAFTHGVPQATTLSGATLAQDKRIRRAILAKAGFKVPKGATFSVGRSRSAALRYAERIGYPVVVKPAQGDNTIETQAGIRDEESLVSAIEYYFTPPSERDRYVRAGYALTELREPGIHNGQIVVPPGYRFLLEKQIPGSYVRLLVLNGRVINALHLPEGPWDSGDQARDVTDEVHESLRDVALGAVRAFRGLSLAAVDVVVQDWRTPAHRKEVPIVELSERPWLAVQGQISPELAEALAFEVLSAGLPTESTPGAGPSVRLKTVLQGAVDPSQFLDSLTQLASDLQVEVEGEIPDAALGDVSVTFGGAARDVAALVETCLETGVGGQRAMLAASTPMG
ncbi:ATP-binding protein [Nesterenkonia suensis]